MLFVGFFSSQLHFTKVEEVQAKPLYFPDGFSLVFLVF